MNPNYNEPMTDPAQSGRKPAKPLPLKLIQWIFVLWSLLGWLRFVRALGERELILSLVGPALFMYLLLAGLAWGTMGLPVLWGLFTRASWTPIALLGAALLYPAFYWIERWLLWTDPFAQRNWPFMLLLTFAWAGLVFWGLQSARSKKFFTNNKTKKEVDNG
jgi:hypothetical protein